jgi:hypothetical protein
MTDDDLIQQMINMSRLLQTDRQCMVSILRLVREHDVKHRPAETEKPRRVPVQISAYGGEGLATCALANDGTAWVHEFGPGWHRLPDLPQD